MKYFKRWISEKAMESLQVLAQAPQDNWWKQLLREWQPSGQGNGLRLAIRENTIDFYRDGWCVAHVGFTQARPLPHAHMSTHVKYLDPASQKTTRVKFSATDHGAAFQHDGKTLSIEQIIANIDARMKLIREGKYKRKGLEKEGVDKIAGKNAAVIDLEMCMPLDEEIALKNISSDKKIGAPRIDIVSLERSPGGANIVFWEAKTFDDPRLRAEAIDNVEVIKQLQTYGSYLAKPGRREDIVEAYVETCLRLVELNAQRPIKKELDPLIEEVASKKIRPGVDLQPRLVIFGRKNGKSACEDKYWARHAERIVKAGIWATYAVDPADIDLTAAAKPIFS